MLQTVLSLAAVVAMILGLAWLTRRMQGLRQQKSSELRVASSIAVGLKERVVIVEAAGTRLVLGVAPGSVRLLHRLEDPALPSFEKQLARTRDEARPE